MAPRVRGRARAWDNAEIARVLRELALRLELERAQFRPRAYEQAAIAVEAAPRPVAEIAAAEGEEGLEALPDIGKGIARRILELLETGRIRDLEALRARTPIDVMALTSIEGVGPHTAQALHAALGIRTVAELEAACRAGRVRDVKGFGERAEQRILRGIEALAAAGGRRLLSEALPIAQRIVARIRALPGVVNAELAGSLRRRKETVGDLDFVAAALEDARVAEQFARFPEVTQVVARGAGKALVRLANGMDADLRVVPPESFGAAWLYFTGSKAHNVKLRRMAQQRGLKLNEYGLFAGARSLASEREEQLYAALELPFIAPELREDEGELEAAAAGKLPRLIEPGALCGDLQVQTDWTDGAASIEEMVRAARARGLSYLAITDHTRDLRVAGGNEEAAILEQVDVIRALNAKLRGFRVLTGAEVNIRADGTLDVSDAVLAQLDVVGAAVHDHFHQPRAEMTRRVLRALESPHVDVLFHPTARLLGRREAVDIDLAALIDAARCTGTVLEIDAMPDRLDLPASAVREAVRAGVKLAIDSDAHGPTQLAYPEEFGIGVARRGWATRADVVNAWPVERCLAALKGGRARPAPRSRRR